MTGGRRFAGVGAVAVLWTMLVAAVWRSGFPLLGERPLSWMVADPASGALFRTALIASAALFVVFHGHVRSRFPTGPAFSVAMLGGMACQVVAAVIPIDGGGAASRVHTSAALALGLSLPVLMWSYATTQRPGPWRRTAWILFFAEVAACVVGVLLSRASVAPLAEVVPAAGFHLWAIVLTLAPATVPGRGGRSAPLTPAVAA